MVAATKTPTARAFRYLLRNGRLVAAKNLKTDPYSDGFQYGYGLFETILYEAKTLYFFGDHCRRLVRSAEAWSIPTVDFSRYDHLILDLVAKNNAESERLKVKLMLLLARPSSEVFVVLERLSSAPSEVKLSSTILERLGFSSPSGPASQHKTCNLMQRVFVRRALAAEGFDDFVLTDQRGLVVEAGFANLALVRGGVLRIVEGSLVLPGIAQSKIVANAGDLFERIERCKGFLFRELFEADEVLYTNALCRAIRVGSLDQKPLPSKGYAERLSLLLKDCH